MFDRRFGRSFVGQRRGVVKMGFPTRVCVEFRVSAVKRTLWKFFDGFLNGACFNCSCMRFLTSAFVSSVLNFSVNYVYLCHNKPFRLSIFLNINTNAFDAHAPDVEKVPSH